MAERAAAAAANRRGGASASKTSSKVKGPRTPTSCDRCKSRKTKCVDPIPGPCKYCAHIGAECGVPTRRKQRPFYHVTEEEYRCSMQILQHFLPSHDLSRETLRSIANDLKSGRAIDDSPSSNLRVGVDQEDEDAQEAEAEPESEEIAELHDQLGCLMEDSLGEYRYVGPESEIAFNAAVCSMKGEPSPEKIIIEPSKFAFPPHKPESVKILHDIPSFDKTYLPPRDYCTYYVARFFEEVHCVYWLYPAEQFHVRLDDLYANQGAKCTASWLCSLYAIFALGAASGDSSCGDLFDEIVSEEARRNPDSKTSHDYLTLAKGLVPQIHEEADIDSIRALAILSLALQTFGFRITSYLYMGTSIRIAFSLGLQHDKSPATHSPVTRQLNRRIWWTLYILDHATASRCGSPCVIDERSLRIQTALPSEQIMNPGTNTPLGILSVSVSLCRLKREIIQTIYHERTSDSRTVSFSKVTSFVSILKKWLETVPSHLKWGVAVAPSHRRSIAILHLNYWSATILLTQPFLLYVVLRGSNLSSQKKIWFENLADVCIDAAQNAMMVLKTMSDEHTISSLITFDSTCALKLIMVLVLALAKTNLSQYREDIECCVSILQGMEQIGFCKTAVQELPLRIGELGIVNKQDDTEAQHDLFVSQLWPELDHSSFVSSVENLQSFSSNPFLMDMEMFMDMDMGLSTLSDSFGFDLVSGPDSYDFSR